MSIVEASRCKTMAEVRAGIDAIDRKIVTLLAERMRYIEAAARIKTDRGMVRDEERKADVHAKVRAAALAAGLSTDLVELLFETLMENSIEHELVCFDAKSA